MPTIDNSLKILILTAGNKDHPSSRIRAIDFIPYLNKINYKATWIPRVPKASTSWHKYILFPFLKRYLYLKVRLAILICKWDVVYIQRAYLEVYYLNLLQKRKAKIIYDFDDALYLHKEDQLNNISKTGLMISSADAVIISTPYLQNFCEKYKVKPIIIPTSVNGEIIKPSKKLNEIDTPVIGWMGSSTTTIVIKEAEIGLRQLAKKIRYKFMMVGANNNYKPEGIHYEHHKWSLEKEAFYLEKMDVGIMPLPLTEYSEGKGGFKLFLYMAAGIPSVATPIGINREIIIDGETGFFANNADEWEQKLYTLLTNKNMAKSMGKNGRRLFEQKYSIDLAFELLLKVINQIRCI